MNPLSKLKDRVTKGKSKSHLTPFFQIAKAFGCVPEILGRDYEVYDKDDNLIYKIRQKPLRFDQLDKMAKELELINKKKYANKKGKNK